MNNDRLLVAVMTIVTLVIAGILSRFLPSKPDPEKKRREDLAALAKKLNWRFNPNSDFKLTEKLSFLSWFRRGDICAYNVFRGYRLEYPVIVFDYTFVAGKYTYYWSAFIVEMKTNFPDMIISHESRESRIAEAFGVPHIAFESADFTRAFRVCSSDKKFAYDVCHPKMMEYLLANKDLTIEISDTAVAVYFEDWLRPERLEFNLSRLIEIRKLLPEYLFTNA